jgi:hypothetical protein
MHIDSLIPEKVYSVIKSWPDREVMFASGENLMLNWATLTNVQKFATLWSGDQRSSGYIQVTCTHEHYILVRPTDVFFKRSQTLKLFRRYLDIAPVIVCLNQ